MKNLKPKNLKPKNLDALLRDVSSKLEEIKADLGSNLTDAVSARMDREFDTIATVVVRAAKGE